MRKSKKEPIPIHFETAENAGEFWDTHDLADYWDETRETDLTFNLQRKHYYISILPKIAEELRKISEKQGVSIETVVNLWLQEKLQNVV
ncbi:MAG: hypothetical protein A2W23_02855 [Planctomycetes bacterium RBG_16_43_13]|nr:MAG: hypothetical protein A2W23_02855 [Planctomycetes bacterium RBG_16_43_13]